MGFLKNLKKKVDKVGGTKFGKLVRKGRDAAVKLVKFGVFLPLLPLLPVINKGLTSRGVNIKKMSFDDKVVKFYNVVVAKKANLETFEDLDPEHFDPVTITLIISSVVSYIKGLKAKKAAGQPLTAKEEGELAQAEKVETNLVVKSANEAVKTAQEITQKSGETAQNTGIMAKLKANIIPISGAIVVIIVVFILLKRKK
jgi:hypothetical protein